LRTAARAQGRRIPWIAVERLQQRSAMRHDLTESTTSSISLPKVCGGSGDARIGNCYLSVVASDKDNAETAGP
jgi:hypothetical protein